MGPVITLYILGGCVALAAVLFIVMIVLSVARPPRLPPLSIDSPPLQRMIRALTPAPFFEEAPTRLAAPRAVPPPPPMPAHVQARSLPAVPKMTAPATTPPPAPAAAVSTSPVKWSVPPKPASLEQQRAVSRPIYPVRRSRKLLWFVIGFFVTSTLVAGAVVAYPPMLDPMCDDYEWFGDGVAQQLREQAREANAAIYHFVKTL
jgi:hypothetical protein